MLRKGVKLLIKKMVDYKKALVAILENTLENVNAGNTNITADISSNNPLFDIVAKPYISKVVTNNVSKLDKALSLIADDKGMVDADGLLTDMIDRLIVSKANTINGVTIGEGSVKITIPFMNKTVVFDKDDFNELKTNIENYEKSK